MTGFAFFGREPFSTVDRIERRYQWTDNVSWLKGHHTFKFGGDINWIQLRSSKTQIFELNFGGLFNFGGLTASNLGLPTSVGGVATPGFSGVQAYGLGLPQSFIQGIGTSARPFSNRSEEHTSELQSPCNLVCRLLLEKKKNPTGPRTLAQFECKDHDISDDAYQFVQYTPWWVAQTHGRAQGQAARMTPPRDQCVGSPL